jgi:hypothetical protein
MILRVSMSAERQDQPVRAVCLRRLGEKVSKNAKYAHAKSKAGAQECEEDGAELG